MIPWAGMKELSVVEARGHELNVIPIEPMRERDLQVIVRNSPSGNRTANQNTKICGSLVSTLGMTEPNHRAMSYFASLNRFSAAAQLTTFQYAAR